MSKKLTKSIIVAMDENRLIGNQNRLPWHLPADLKHFKETTLGHAIIMGRKTYESIGRPLPERTNIVLSSNANYQTPGCYVVTSLAEAIELGQTLNKSEVFIIGGASIYAQALPEVDRIYLTLIHHVFAGDTYFPVFDRGQWKEVSRVEHPSDEKNKYPYTFLTLE